MWLPKILACAFLTFYTQEESGFLSVSKRLRGMMYERGDSSSYLFIMRVLTFGWEYPPSRNGGLGVACHGLTRELVADGTEVLFVLPKQQPTKGDNHFIFADGEFSVTVKEVVSSLVPYHQADSYVKSFVGYDATGNPQFVSRSILEEVHRFAHQASLIARQESFDIIHAHDWTSYLAGVAAKKVSGKALILHVHATSFDQAAGDNVDPSIFQIECEAFAAADKVVTVSQLTKNIITSKHGVPAEKVAVVHNGCDVHEPLRHQPTLSEYKKAGQKIVLYHGRISVQKGVDYFVKAAARVLEYEPNVLFVISGWGDMQQQIIRQVGEAGLSDKVLFAGALWEEERDTMYQSVDLVVMPSVSEPFGLVPLEALQHGTPALISKQSGVAEVLTHVLKVDFWDVDEIANQIIAALRYEVLQQQLASAGNTEIKKLSWRQAAEKIQHLYQGLLQYVTS